MRRWRAISWDSRMRGGRRPVRLHRLLAVCGSLLIVLTSPATPPVGEVPVVEAQSVPVLYWGSQGGHVPTLQARLRQWGYYDGPVDGVFGHETSQAVRLFQRRNGLPDDGVVGRQTWVALGLLSAVRGAGASGAGTAAVEQPRAVAAVSRNDEINLLSRVIAAEARGEPYVGQVAVAAVVLNRVEHPAFPNTLSGVIYQPHAFESVTNGLIWRRTPTQSEIQAAVQALNGWDPTYGSTFFWNPSKPVNAWIWSRPIVTRFGSHVFAQ